MDTEVQLQKTNEISIQYSPMLTSSRLKLIELDPEIEEAMCDPANEECTWTVKGSGKDNAAVLTSSKATFLMRKAETSNTLLLLNEFDKRTNVVVGELGFYYELMKTKAKLEDLRSLLLTRPVSENKHGGSISSGNAPGFLFEELLNSLQTSERELLFELERIGATILDGRWTLVEPELEAAILNILLCTIIEFSMDVSAVNVNTLKQELKELYSEALVELILSKYSLSLDNESCSLDQRKVSRTVAESILWKQPQNEMPKESFLNEWATALPDTIKAEFSVLRGMALETENGGCTCIRLFRAESLPDSPQECFQHLFRIRRAWSFGDLEPYIEHLVQPRLSKPDLLRKFTRSSRISPESEERVLTAR